MSAPPRQALCEPGCELSGQEWTAFAGGAGTVAGARSWTAGFLGRLPDTDQVAAGDIVLVVCELVTNAVRHAPGPCWLYLAAVPEGMRVEVHDSSACEPRPRPGDLKGGGGHGWHLVAALSLAADTRPCRHGKAVSAVLPFP